MAAIAPKEAFRTPAIERAAGIAVLSTVCDATDGAQADKSVVLGYIKEIFEEVPFSWPNMTGFYRD